MTCGFETDSYPLIYIEKNMYSIVLQTKLVFVLKFFILIYEESCLKITISTSHQFINLYFNLDLQESGVDNESEYELMPSSHRNNNG